MDVPIKKETGPSNLRLGTPVVPQRVSLDVCACTSASDLFALTWDISSWETWERATGMAHTKISCSDTT